MCRLLVEELEKQIEFARKQGSQDVQRLRDELAIQEEKVRSSDKEAEEVQERMLLLEGEANSARLEAEKRVAALKEHYHQVCNTNLWRYAVFLTF